MLKTWLMFHVGDSMSKIVSRDKPAGGITKWRPASMSDLTILYVEDDHIVREQLSQFLRRRARALYQASNGKEGLDNYLAYRPDLVITDVRMPVMDGLQMANQIRAESAGIPIVVTTAFGDREYLERAKEIALDCYVTKPVNPNKLSSAIEQCAARIVADRVMRLSDQPSASTSDAVVVADLNGRILATNQPVTMLTGYSAGELQGRSLEVLMGNDSKAPLLSPQRVERTVRNADGRSFSAWIAVTPVLSGLGKLDRWLLAFVDCGQLGPSKT